MGKPNYNAKKELKKGPWTRDEDQKLMAYVQQHGHASWRSLPAKAGLERCGKSCRMRWTNYLRPDIKRGKFSTDEEKTIIRLHALLGNRWSYIAAYLPKRTDNEIKNYWNTRLKKRLIRMGIDPSTHKPKNNNPGGSAQSRHAANASHMAQWETARLEAEARHAHSSKLRLLPKFTAASPSLPRPAPLNFSSNSGAVPTVSLIVGNGVVSGNNNIEEEKGKIENSLQIHNDTLAYDHVEYDNYHAMGAMDLAAANHNSEFEDIMKYWNDLLNTVSSPMELPMVLG